MGTVSVSEPDTQLTWRRTIVSVGGAVRRRLISSSLARLVLVGALVACGDDAEVRQSEDHACTWAPCQNGGTCMPNGADFSCACVTGWTGSTCETLDTCQGFELKPGRSEGDTRGQGDDDTGCPWHLDDGTVFHQGRGAEDQRWSLTLATRTSVTITVEGFDAAIYILQGDDCSSARLVEGHARTEKRETRRHSQRS